MIKSNFSDSPDSYGKQNASLVFHSVRQVKYHPVYQKKVPNNMFTVKLKISPFGENFGVQI